MSQPTHTSAERANHADILHELYQHAQYFADMLDHVGHTERAERVRETMRNYALAKISTHVRKGYQP